MFILSQCILHKCNAFSKLETISTYSIIVGLIFYASIYLYILFYNVEYISIFNKFIIYIVGIDLLLSTFYYSMNTPTVEQDTTIPLLQENVEESQTQSDSESEDFFESAHEIDEDEDEIDDEDEIYENLDEEKLQQNEEIANEEIANEEIANEEKLQQNEEKLQQNEEIANEEIAKEEIANEEIAKEEIANVIGEMEKFDFKGLNLQQTMVDDIVIEIPEEIIVKKKKKGGRPSKKNLNIN